MSLDQKNTSQSEIDRQFMAAAIELAQLGIGQTSPNPAVGCVLVRNNKIIGKGWHKGPGKPHAEPEAIRDARDGGQLIEGATAYVTLEPCSHHGRTGPCTEALIAAGVSEVVYAVDDPNPLAAGGAAVLRDAGVTVRKGPLIEEVEKLNRGWLYKIKTGRPLVIAKAAMSLDGRIATSNGDSKWITSPISRRKGHELRRESDAIVVGVGTVCADDPTLTARLDNQTYHPHRITIDSVGRSPLGAKVFDRSGLGASVFTTRNLSFSRQKQYEELGVNVVKCESSEIGQVDPYSFLDNVSEMEINSILIEGGGKILGSFLDADLIDEVHLFYAPLLIGGGEPAFNGYGVERIAAAGGFSFDAPELIDTDFYIRGRRNREAR